MPVSMSLVGDDHGDDFEIDADMPESHRRISFVTTSDKVISNQTHNGSFFHNIVKDLYNGPIYVRVVYVFVVAVALGGVSYYKHSPDDPVNITDLCVLSVIYGAWIVFCAPMLLATLNVRLVAQIVPVLFKVFFAEAAVMAYAFYRGHNNIFRRGFSMQPTLEANRSGKGLAWLGEAGYNIRLATVFSCLIIAFITNGIEAWVFRPM
ncbi:uncharacterized protein [Littorina saxatilis]|uniref:Uncharacterized protein n=1 Tax=Littorina saxatilis TaxID=31220 RepID=A0AAN9G4Z7_9CAEN